MRGYTLQMEIQYPMENGIILFRTCYYISKRIIAYSMVSIKIYMDKNEKKEQEEIINKLSKQSEEVEIVKKEEEDQDRAC